MSFGYGVSDVVSVAALCWKVYKKCKNSSGEFNDVAVEVSCLHSVLKEADEVSSEQRLSNQQQARLKPLKDGILGLLNELEERLDKYESLGTQSMRTMDRMGWAMDVSVAELRQKLIAQTTLLDAFNNSTSHARLERKLNQLILEVRAGKRQGSVISSRTLNSNDGNSWKELRRELGDIGISADVIREKRTFIVAWFEEAVAAGRLEEEEPDSDSDEERSSDSEEEIEQNDDISGITEAQRQIRRPQVTQSKTTVKTQEPSLRRKPQLTQLKTTPMVMAEQSSGRQTRQPQDRTSYPSWLSNLIAGFYTDGELLLQAAYVGDAEKVKRSLERGASINYAKKNWPKSTALHLVASHGHGSVMELLLSKGADTEVRDANKGTPLHSAARYGKNLALLTLLDNGANIEAPGSKNYTPLHRAAYYGMENSVQLLLEKGAKIDAQSMSGSTPLHRAAGSGKNFALLVLLNNGANVEATDSKNCTPLHRAASHGMEKAIKLLLEKGAKIDAQSMSGRTPLHSAAKCGKNLALLTLLNNGANIEALDSKNCTPLHRAAYHGMENSIQLLLKKGAKIDAQDIRGRTPLHLATSIGSKAIMRLLLNRGADWAIKDFDGKIALGLADRYDYNRMMALSTIGDFSRQVK